MFYQQVNGIVLVHDVSNRKSYKNLWRWIAEVLDSEAYKESERAMSGSWSGSGSGSWAGGNASGSGIFSPSASSSGFPINGNRLIEFDFDLQIGERNASVPILLVGTKADLVKQELTGRQRRYSIVEEYGGDCVNVCTLALTHFAQSSIAAEKIDAFFDKVIDKKFGTGEPLQSPTFGVFTSSSSLSGAIATRDDRRRVLNIVPPTPGITGPGTGSPGLISGFTGQGVGGNGLSLKLSSSNLRQQYNNQTQQQQRTDPPLRTPTPANSLRGLYNNPSSRPPSRGSNTNNGLFRSTSSNNVGRTNQSSSWSTNSVGGGGK